MSEQQLIQLKRPHPQIHPDVAILWGILKERGYAATYEDIHWAWSKHSRQAYNHQWIAVPTNDDALCFSVLKRMLKVAE